MDPSYLKKSFEDPKKYEIEFPGGRRVRCTKLAVCVAGYLTSMYGFSGYLVGEEVPKIEGYETPELYILCNNTYVAKRDQVFPENIKVIYIHFDENMDLSFRGRGGEILDM